MFVAQVMKTMNTFSRTAICPKDDLASFAIMSGMYLISFGCSLKF